MSRTGRRVAVAMAVLIPATLATAFAVNEISAEPSRASSRWNHVASQDAQTLDASEAGFEPAYRGPVWKQLRLVEAYGSKFTFVDVGRRGDSPGDYGVFRDPVFSSTGERIGTIDVQCIAAYSDHCQGSIRLPGRGQITFAGISPLGRDPDRYAVTGGTGIYAGVGGMLLIQFPNIDRARLTLTLTR